MRDLKFRAFIDGEMIYYNHPQLVCNNVTMLMQYTNIKDKNGKEIYEGDIVKILREDNYFGGKDFEEIIKVGQSEWVELGDLPSGGPEGDCPIKKIEVIGNTYENPELLTK